MRSLALGRFVALVDDFGRNGPDKDGAFGPCGDDEGLVRGDGHAVDGPTMADADVLADSFVVVPELHQPVL